MILSHAIPNLAFDRARISPKQEAIFDYDSGIRYSYSDLENRSEKLAYFLTKELGLKKGDRIGFIARTCVGMFDAFYASCKTGIIITTYNGLLKTTELIGLVENEEPKVIFFSEFFRGKASNIRDTVRGIREFICLDDFYGPENRYSYQDILKCEVKEKLSRPLIDPEDLHMLVHTGGTTGTPKAAILSYRSVFMNAISEILTWQLTCKDSAYIAMPLFHTGGWNLLTLPLLMTGGKLVLASVFDPGKMLKISKEEKPSIFMGVEAMFNCISNHPDFATTDLSCYNWMINGGGPICKKSLEPYWNRGIRVFNGYGATEIGPNNLSPDVVNMTLEENRKKINTVGKPFFFNQLRIVDPEGNDVPQGKPGELLWKGELSFSGYWNHPEAMEEIMVDGWIRSGDVGYMDKDGDVYICGRLKNMYISAGENIYPLEVESVINSHPHVKKSCVIGVADKRLGEVGRALVVPNEGYDLAPEELKEYLIENLSSIKRPKYITIVESIPRNEVGKKDMRLIQEMYGTVKER
ncbi:AMP-binding protein [Dehalobacterium formicoaceticum]|uniref:AMP-binding protein n=1 Tax=Dehalobacterium formicoaceticum TaxID=51515 RepID=A0ABT1Y7V6_9FIRM|nr:AMP-binding protein [Dehalobacterium formicoaceticum]MCR6546958.1 AMP-binding protein [Dehalobacterium formicoaceticum]